MSERMSVPVFASQMRMVRAWPPLTMQEPSGENAAAIPLPCPRIERTCLPLRGSHTRIVSSTEALRIRDPSGEKVTLFTELLCPFKRRSFPPVFVSQIRIAFSLPLPPPDALTIRLESDEKETELTWSLCPRKHRNSAPVSASHIRTMQSSPPLTRYRLSCEKLDTPPSPHFPPDYNGMHT